MNTITPSVYPELDEVIKEATKGLGKVNIIIAGKTGVGKSTLINSVFRGKFAETGSGKPVTKRIEEISKEGFPLTIIDTKGLELKDYEKIVDDLAELISERSESHDENKHIHIAWLCILEDGQRVEEGEKKLCEMFEKKKIPVVAVITKSRSDKVFHQTVKELLPSAKVVLSVRAIEEEIDNDGERVKFKAMGLNELIRETGKLLPESKKRAYVNALSSRHAASIKLKIEQAETEVNIACAAAGTAAAVPIPFSDAIAIVPIQVGMLAKVGITFGMEISTAALTTLVVSALGASAATLIGRTLVTAVLKMFPGAGSVAGGTIAATTAIALTKAMGNAYISILTGFIEKNPGKELDIDLIGQELKKKMSLFS